MASVSNNNIRDAFEHFREELDEHNDRRERLIKASRDITNVSKRTIFLLHRLVQDANTNNSDEYISACKNAAKQGRDKLQQVNEIYTGLKEDLIDEERFWRYHRQVSPGLQEYIEALSFAHFLEHGTLITSREVQQTLMNADGQAGGCSMRLVCLKMADRVAIDMQFFPLTTSDYLLGISDLTGELMRYAISGFGRLGGRSRANEVCSFVRNCKADLERFTPYVWELNKKQMVTAQSLTKIEDAAYAVAIRTSEYDLSPDQLDQFVDNFLATYSEDKGRDS
ncbi:hypothetical protein AAF712_001120 [Marasmius tenuissimus]|uniref:Translin n=1 Tax=Marasmius tenuissimus TaxID=585030 RepID=A0ABR3AFN6_9AGAR